MAIRKRVRQAGRKLLAHVRRGREVVQRRRKSRALARSASALGLDGQLHALATEVLKGKPVECSWDAFLMVHFPELSDTLADQEAAAVELGDWAGRRGIKIEFTRRAARIGSLELDLIYVRFSAR